MSVNQEIDIILEDILEVEGVTGAMATDGGGKVLAARMLSVYDYGTLNQMSNKLAKTLANVQSYGIRFEEVIYNFSETRLIVRNLRRGFLIIMSLQSISVPLLNVATNAAKKRITRILTFSKRNQ